MTNKRGFAFVKLKNGESYHYEVEEKPDGYYYLISHDNIPSEYKRNVKLTKTRNYMQAENKANEEFAKIREQLKSEGKYKHSYSSMWTEPSSSSFNYDYENKPSPVTRMHNYGMPKYYLEFSTNDDVKYENGKWEVGEKNYYAIDWKPTTPIELQINKTTYKNGAQTAEKKLSKVVKEVDKEGIKELVEQFRELYEAEKKKREAKRVRV